MIGACSVTLMSTRQLGTWGASNVEKVALLLHPLDALATCEVPENVISQDRRSMVFTNIAQRLFLVVSLS